MQQCEQHPVPSTSQQPTAHKRVIVAVAGLSLHVRKMRTAVTRLAVPRRGSLWFQSFGRMHRRTCELIYQRNCVNNTAYRRVARRCHRASEESVSRLCRGPRFAAPRLQQQKQQQGSRITRKVVQPVAAAAVIHRSKIRDATTTTVIVPLPIKLYTSILLDAPSRSYDRAAHIRRRFPISASRNFSDPPLTGLPQAGIRYF